MGRKSEIQRIQLEKLMGPEGEYRSRQSEAGKDCRRSKGRLLTNSPFYDVFSHGTHH